MQTLLGERYLELLADEGVDVKQGFGVEEGYFLGEALAAAGSLESCASPFYLQLTAFDFVQASGLQIARAPGENVIYFGFALLSMPACRFTGVRWLMARALSFSSSCSPASLR